jgi:U6 snRNA-associated Sm-like protein LSm4
MIDTKNGESYDGILMGCDNYMNIRMKDVIITSADGTFCKCPEIFIRGNNVKAIQLSEDIIEKHIGDMKKKCIIFCGFDKFCNRSRSTSNESC